MMKHSNKLAEETSPYLLQHAHNPVNWNPWNEEALQRAKEENKPILVSIGYAACHWCHVMERESFEDEETADIMNEFFINIKIDREERPDLDHIYMDAVQAMTGSGGWPLNVFLTPDGKPFYGGTYFPPVAMANRPSWRDVLYGVANAYRQTPDQVNEQANQMTNHLLQSNTFGLSAGMDEQAGKFKPETADLIFSNIMKTADRRDGGFGRAPKFPQTLTIEYLLVYYQLYKHEDALKQACLSLDKMINGGLYDQAGGGFSRYSTDAVWLVPHFEKMLYDNALLLIVLSEAYQVTHRKIYKEVIEATIDFVKREMLSPEQGFYAALDADSEGVEGKFYVWSKKEIESLLGSKADLFSEFYGVTEKGNWEEQNILHIKRSVEEFAQQKNMPVEELEAQLSEGRRKLLEKRTERIRPQLDDKILLGWNALMITALCKCYAALGNKEYKILAEQSISFLLNKFQVPASADYFHTYKNSIAKYPAFLDDYAFLIQALIHLQEITGDVKYLQKAMDLTSHVIENFEDETGLFFYYTHQNQSDVVIRKKEIYDGALPSGNSIMAWNLQYLAVVCDNRIWSGKVEEMLKHLFDAITKYPTSFGTWAVVLQKQINSVNEIVIIGDDEKFHQEILHIFIPNKILQVSVRENDDFPLLKGKRAASKPLIYLCKNYVCDAPVDNISSLIRALGYTN